MPGLTERRAYYRNEKRRGDYDGYSDGGYVKKYEEGGSVELTGGSSQGLGLKLRSKRGSLGVRKTPEERSFSAGINTRGNIEIEGSVSKSRYGGDPSYRLQVTKRFGKNKRRKK